MQCSKIEQKLSRWAMGLHAAGLLIAAVACGQMVSRNIVPLADENARIVTRELKLREVLDLEFAVTSENERLTRTLAEANQKIQSLLDRIPNVPRESDFLGQITTLAREVGVDIRDYHPGRVLPGEDYHEMTLTLTSRGSYDGVCNFLHRLSDLPRLSRAKSLSLQPLVNEQAYSMDMTLTIYFAPTSRLVSAVPEEPNG